MLIEGSCTPNSYSHSKWYYRESNVRNTMENERETLKIMLQELRQAASH